jgi:2-polyprenyl-3-methyl-5-hydroxy-6-metoxy-1,4-benzoquinol methylase
MNSNMNDCYKNLALNIEDGIPIFSQTDFYVENYDRISSDHLKHFEATGLNPFMKEDSWKEIEKSTEELVNKYVTEPGVKILDVGVGMGRLLERFPRLNRFGMDISRGYLKHAKTLGIEVCMSRIEEIPYKEGYFDIVVTTDVLEHVLDLNLAVSKILSVVKEGGVIVVRVPYKENLEHYLNPDYPYNLVHLRNFDENTLRILFEKIFNAQVLEWTLTGCRGGRLKVGANIRYYSGIIRRILNIVKKLNDNMYDYFSERLCQPVEINMVIRNSKRNTSRSQ